jgi:archaellum component FlaC
MLIANPIYDIVFKYLMEDLDIAREILSMILNTEIISLSVQSQEVTTEVKTTEKTPVNIYRLDFIAVFKEEDGTTKKALIELQKTKRSTNVTRFRKYLGENYKKEDKITENGLGILTPLEIITIYLLGFELEDVPVAILKVKNCFVDVVTGETLKYQPKDKFIRLLNHESYTIQIPKLKPNEQNQIEMTLDIFNQRYKTDNIHILNYDSKAENALINKILSRLTRAIADEDLRRQMNFEDEIETEFQAYDTQIEGYKQEIKEKDKTIEDKDRTIEDKDRTIEDKDKTIKALMELLSKKDE